MNFTWTMDIAKETESGVVTAKKVAGKIKYFVKNHLTYILFTFHYKSYKLQCRLTSKKCKNYKNVPTIFVLPSKKEVWRQPKRAILSQKYIGFVSSIFLLGVFTQKTHLQTLWWKSTLSELTRKISQKK